MLLFILSLHCGIIYSAILQSPHIREFVGELCDAKSLAKSGMIHPKWINVETVYNRLTPTSGLLENKKSKTIVFETKTSSLNEDELLEKLKVNCDETDYQKIKKYIETRDWQNLFDIIIFTSEGLYLENNSEFGETLSEIAGIADFEKRTQISGDNHCTYLCIAQRREKVNTLNLLEIFLRKGANVDAQENDGTTALMQATSRGSLGAVKILLNHNANPNLQDKYGNTALHNAWHSSRDAIRDKAYCRVVELLLQYGADPTIKNHWFSYKQRAPACWNLFYIMNSPNSVACPKCTQKLNSKVPFLERAIEWFDFRVAFMFLSLIFYLFSYVNFLTTSSFVVLMYVDFFLYLWFRYYPFMYFQFFLLHSVLFSAFFFFLLNSSAVNQ